MRTFLFTLLMGVQQPPRPGRVLLWLSRSERARLRPERRMTQRKWTQRLNGPNAASIGAGPRQLRDGNMSSVRRDGVGQPFLRPELRYLPIFTGLGQLFWLNSKEEGQWIALLPLFINRVPRCAHSSRADFTRAERFKMFIGGPLVPFLSLEHGT
jgi:hypothetical protein